MRVFLLVMGTRGDLEIMLQLASELDRRGHEAVLGSSPFYEPRVNQQGVRFREVGHGSRAELLDLFRGLTRVDDRRKRVEAYAQAWLRPQIEQGHDATDCVVCLSLTKTRHEYLVEPIQHAAPAVTIGSATYAAPDCAISPAHQTAFPTRGPPASA